MNRKIGVYHLIKKIHLYASLSTVALLMMYLTTSFMMIYHDWFQVQKNEKPSISIEVKSSEIERENWDQFLKKHDIKGRLVEEKRNKSGGLVRKYESANKNFKIVINKDKNEVEINASQLNLSGSIIGLHRMRGYGGSLRYNIYAFLLDLVGISLIVFAISGVILWLNILKNNKMAWAIFILGFIYVSLIIGYLLMV